MRILFALVLATFAGSTTHAAEPGKRDAQSSLVHGASDEGELAIKKFKAPAGFKIELFAAEPMLANPVCFAFDEQGRAYVAETFRHTHGTLDVRQYMQILDEELAGQTIEDHLAKIRRHLADFPDMTRETERLSLVQDTDGDGKADKATIFAEGFNSELSGIAAGVLARKGKVYFTCIPDLYLLQDKDGDGKAELRDSLQTGYGVRFAFIGHDLHGLRIGPDGKLYFSIGDRGFNVQQGEKTVAFAEGGAVLRCNLDGSDLEIYAYGLRNPQELAFDDYGNLFTGDNNSDGGDQARWVHVVEGGDSGWRIGWQYITHPNNRGPWNSERMWDPQGARDVGYIVPPLANIGNGPSGLTYYPGVGLPDEFNGHFFLCDFKGSGARSLVHTFSNKPKGASFELVGRRDFVSSILATDVEFGPDSAVYISDWTEGWDKPGKGRLYRVSPTDVPNASLVAETKKLIGDGMEKRSTEELIRLLAHRDQRVRQEAQFALADKGEKAIKPLVQVAQKHKTQLARIHAIWGLGQIAAANPKARASKNPALEPLVPLLADDDTEIRSQAARVLGDGRYARAYDGFVKLLQNGSAPRAKFFAALGLGKLRDKRASFPLIEMLRANNDEDAFLRHAGVMGLVLISDNEAIIKAASDNSPAVRLAAAVAMRRLHWTEVSMLLNDKQQNVRLEAARAINDLPIIQSLPDLARLIDEPNYDLALFRRVLNANFRIGEPENAAALAKLAARGEAPSGLRLEALQMLTEWAKPAGRDRVTGLWRPLAERDSAAAVAATVPILEEIVKTGAVDLKIAALDFVENYKVNNAPLPLFELLSDTANDIRVRVQALKLLALARHEKLSEALDIAAQDKNETLRKEAIALQVKLKPADAAAALVDVIEHGTVGERQNALATFGTLQTDLADRILGDWMDKLLAGDVRPELQLDLLEAASKRSSSEIKSKLARYEAARSADTVGKFQECLSGGNAEEGKKIFRERVEASCIRCHKIGGDGGDAGPELDGIATKKTREALLQSLVDPNAEIAPGFESVTIKLKNGTTYAGVLKSETPTELIINSPEEGGIVTLKKSEVASRERGMSAMPPEITNILSRQDLRNLVEYLATLK